MNRGSPVPAADPGFAPRGFNEAPIHESGKSRDLDRRRPLRRRFNEAPIHESGKSECLKVKCR